MSRPGRNLFPGQVRLPLWSSLQVRARTCNLSGIIKAEKLSDIARGARARCALYTRAHTYTYGNRQPMVLWQWSPNLRALLSRVGAVRVGTFGKFDRSPEITAPAFHLPLGNGKAKFSRPLPPHDSPLFRDDFYTASCAAGFNAPLNSRPSRIKGKKK